MRALRKRLACAGGKREQFSPGCVWGSIASIPILRSSLCFFLWHQRKKGDFETIIQNESLPDFNQLKEAITGQDIVYANLSGDLEAMAKNIVKAMDEKGVKKLIFISSIGIYDVPLKPVLKPYRKAADVIEASDLEYAILRPTWFTNAYEVDYETTRKGEPEKGSVISQKRLETFIATIIESPEKYLYENLGVNKPNS